MTSQYADATLLGTGTSDVRLSVRAGARTGSILAGKWQLGRVLGVGGTSTVYEAVHKNGRRAAVKVLHPELVAHERTKARFLREGYVVNRIEHAGVVAVLDDGEDDGTAFLVMELLRGETAAERTRRLGGRLPEGEVLFIAAKVLDVLAQAHQRGIVHRDVKPENVFIEAQGQVRLLDFGIAAARELSGWFGDVTRSGSTLGTPAFMPPEQARGRWQDVDARTDVWALGATMFFLLSGRHVHGDVMGNELLITAATELAPSLRSVRPDLCDALVRVVDGATLAAREARWQSAREFARELETAARLAGSHSDCGGVFGVPSFNARPEEEATLDTVFSPAGWQTSNPRRRPALMPASAVPVLVAFIAAGAAMLRSDAPNPSGVRSPSSRRVHIEPSHARAPSASSATVETDAIVRTAELPRRSRAPLRTMRARPPTEATRSVTSSSTSTEAASGFTDAELDSRL